MITELAKVPISGLDIFSVLFQIYKSPKATLNKIISSASEYYNRGYTTSYSKPQHEK